MAAPPPPRLPEEVMGHPLLKRLAPELRARVLQQLHGIAARESGDPSAAYAAADPYAAPQPYQQQVPPPHQPQQQTQTQPQYASQWQPGSGDSVAPPQNHSHAQAQTTFPRHIQTQTDDVAPTAAPGAQHWGGGVGAAELFDPPPAHHVSIAAPPQQPRDAMSPPRPGDVAAGGSPPPHYPAAHPADPYATFGAPPPGAAPVATTADAHAAARAILGSHPEAQAVRGEAHARMLAERLLAEHHRTNPPPLGPEFSGAAALGYPSPGQPGWDGGAGGGGGALSPLQRNIQNEFWRHFNAEFDRQVVLARDPDADSLLAGAADDAVADPFVSGQDDGFVARANPRARDDARRQVQNEFWNEYARSLDDKMRPGMPYPGAPPYDAGYAHAGGAAPGGHYHAAPDTGVRSALL